jgi:hypothetical protein
MFYHYMGGSWLSYHNLKTEVQKVLLLARKCTNGDSTYEWGQHFSAVPICATR